MARKIEAQVSSNAHSDRVLSVLHDAQAPARSLLREERYDPYTGVTITVWSNAAGAAIPAEQRLN